MWIVGVLTFRFVGCLDCVDFGLGVFIVFISFDMCDLGCFDGMGESWCSGF